MLTRIRQYAGKWAAIAGCILAGGLVYAATPHFPHTSQAEETPNDSLRFAAKPTAPVTQKDLDEKMFDLQNPDNITSKPEYDEKTGNYVIGAKIGDSYLNTPLLMTPDEYRKWSLKKSTAAYYRKKNTEAYESKGKEAFSFTDMKFDLGPAEKIFGPGGVQIKTQGSAELKIGGNLKNVDNPSLPINRRKTFGLDFDEKLDLSLQGKIGDKMDLNLNYNTEATFDFDSKNLKLQYEGKEDEIVKLIEGGNISMPTNNSLIQGSNSLFGVRTDLQFGKLKLQAVVSQKKSVSKSVSSNGGAQMTTFEINADNYESNRHFFLSHWFREHYDNWMKGLPNIQSGITINRVEVWVTNKNGTTTNTRNIVAFTDLGEASREHYNTNLWSTTGKAHPTNGSNNLYSTINQQYENARNISDVATTLSGISNFEGGVDYEKLESARLLTSSEYSLNKALGYISIKTAIQTDQVLAVAYEYTYMGQTYQVGEFSSNQTDNKRCLYVKTLKNAANTPSMKNWPLMMKNVYSLGATSIDQSNFRLDVKYLSDTTGVYLSYLPEEKFKNTPLLRLLGMDRLDNKNNTNPNGYFDFVEGYTVNRSTGRIFLPSVEPFGNSLRNAIGDENIAQKYVFQELYDTTKTAAKQVVEKDKFMFVGQYKASSSNVISLGAMNVPRGSVVVTAGGVELVENSDYSVNYGTGEVTILNQSILDAGTSINVSLEGNAESFERKTMLGLNWEYDFSKDFLIGGTLMHLSEQSLTTKVAMGNEPLNNTILGLNISWKKKSQWLTDLINKVPFINATKPSNINFSAEFAHLFTGKNDQSQAGASYLDDFENTKMSIDVSSPHDWTISSVPLLFNESSLTDDIKSGYRRSLLSWYNIDPLFTRRSSSLTPGHIKGDVEQLSNHYVREVNRSELFPNREMKVGESSSLDILNLAYYPNIRGPYNLNPEINIDGTLLNPKEKWGGMMRSIENTDFEALNIEYMEFWMMDPYIYTRNQGGNLSGDFYINLGDISEDILKDGHKFYESGMPLNGDTQQYEEFTWGKIPNQTTVTYAFNTSSGARDKQDVGFNGLTDAEETEYPAYANYLAQIRSKVSQQVYDSIAQDPAGDDYQYFRGKELDAAKMTILERYKRINNPQGNSEDSDHSTESYSKAYKTTPDAEDINGDYTLNEYNNYYQYKVHLSPDSMNVGMGYIVDRRQAGVTLRNGNKETVNWYLFRIPLREYQKKEGNINDFSSIRFMRMFLTGFSQPIILRFGTLELVRGEWRNYERSLAGNSTQNATGSLEVSAVSIEENNEKTPVNYVLPPGVSRNVDPGQSQLTEDNEQGLNITVKNLAAGDARAIYKNMNLDLRQYRHIQMFAHANALIGDASINDSETSVFVRIGSDYKNNYYEYEIPLKLTPARHYDTYTLADCQAVWPEDNMLDIDFELLTNLKNKRDKLKGLNPPQASYTIPYSEYDSNKPNNKITVMGNPSLGEVRTMMIGVRNNSRSVKSVEVWVNELRLQDYTDEGGWAARAKLDIQLSDLATIDLSGHIETSGFGGLEQGITERRNDNLYEYSLTTNVQLGKLLPEKAQVSAPLYYSYSKRKIAPKYNPLDSDVRLEDALDAMPDKQSRDSLENLTTSTTIDRNFSLSNVRLNVASKNPMPYDPANFSFGYAHSHKFASSETKAWETNDNWKLNANYSYSPNYTPLEPFSFIKSKSAWWKMFQDEKINYLPQSLNLTSTINRTYYELQERDIQSAGSSTLPIVWSSDFLWNRSLSLNWDITNNLHASIQTATNAEIVEPYTPINKSLYPDHYTAWKDSVWNSIRHMGTPLQYQQAFNASYKIPITKLPILDWISSELSYESTYNWNRGAILANKSSLGNTISNSRNIRAGGKLNFEQLYNKVPFLKETNTYFSSKRSSLKNEKSKSLRQNADSKDTGNESDAKKQKFFEQEIHLLADSDTTLIITHNQKSRKIRISALRANGRRYPLKYKIKNSNAIEILSHDTASIKLAIRPQKPAGENTWYKIGRFAARTAMMVRSLNINYTNSYQLSLPGFMPNAGDVFGQKNYGGLAPGLDFAFGLTDDSYIEKAKNRNWLLDNDSISSPATTNLSENLQISATIEPIDGLKIDLTASRTQNKARSILYMYNPSPTTQSGAFTMTTISLATAFDGIGTADDGYQSKTFQKFVGYLGQFQKRLEAKYEGVPYPVGSTLAGKNFSAANAEAYGTIDTYSSDVMVPAFLAAYCGGNTSSSLDVFPSITRLLPNWTVTYGGLMRLRWFREHFKSFTLDHSYKSVYAVGSYNSYSSYMNYMDNMGFITNVQTGNPIPSSMYDISTVSINEAFSPLCGFSVTFRNSLTASIKYNRLRVLTLSMTSQQITETFSNDFVIGLGYKINDLKLFGKPHKARKITGKRKGNSRNKGGKRGNNQNNDNEEDLSKDNEPEETGMSNPLNLRADFSLRDQSAINRNVITLLSQATSGNKALKLSLAADYTVSKLLTLSAYYDRQTTTPLLSSSSYPTTQQDFGLSIKFSLVR